MSAADDPVRDVPPALDRPAVDPPAVDPANEDPAHDAGFWIGLVLALPVFVYGLRGLLDALSGDALVSFVQYFVGGAIVHDLVLAPAVCVIGWFVVRIVPRPAVAPVQVGLIVTGIVTLISWPFLRGYGATAGEPSFLSRNYAASLAVVLVVTWVGVAVAVTTRVVSARHR